MKTGAKSDTRLHRYFDGELDAGEMDEMRKTLAEDPVAKAKLDALASLRSGVRAVNSVPEISADALWDRIEAQLAAPGEESGLAEAGLASNAPRLRVVESGSRPNESALTQAGSANAEPRKRTSSHSERSPSSSPSRTVSAVIGGLALAAAAAVAYFSGGESDPGAPSAAEQLAETEILEVDFGDNSGAIFAIEDEDGNRYAVVWLADIEPKPEVQQ